MENFKKIVKKKKKLKSIYPKNHEISKNSKPRVQFYWSLYKKECTEFNINFSVNHRSNTNKYIKLFEEIIFPYLK